MLPGWFALGPLRLHAASYGLSAVYFVCLLYDWYAFSTF
jgi:hypothetical protein